LKREFQEHPILSQVESLARQPRKNLLVIVATMREARLHERERSGFLLQCTTAVLTENSPIGIYSVRLCWKGVYRGVSPMPGDPKECRQHALNCVRLAQTSSSQQARDQFANLARTWIRLADEIESTDAFLTALDDEMSR
jgi:hypothetical protein